MALRVACEAEPTCGSTVTLAVSEGLRAHAARSRRRRDRHRRSCRFKGRNQCGLVDDGATADIDDDAIRPECFQHLCIDRMFRFCTTRRHHHQRVAGAASAFASRDRGRRRRPVCCVHGNGSSCRRLRSAWQSPCRCAPDQRCRACAPAWSPGQLVGSFAFPIALAKPLFGLAEFADGHDHQPTAVSATSSVSTSGVWVTITFAARQSSVLTWS